MEYQPFSVAISVYKFDVPSFFDRALKSITDQQTVKPDEIVLVVDGPVPNETNIIIDKYSKKNNLRVIRLETNGGLGNALKIATENCSYELIARMDSDDIATPTRFADQLRYFNDNPDVDVLGGNISEFVDDEMNIISYRCVPTSNVELRRFLKKRCPFNHMTVMFKKASIMKSGGYIDWHYNEDYFLWIRMFLNNAVFANISEILVNVRTGKEQFARRGGRKYFASEKRLQKYMLEKKVINKWTYFKNVFKRFIVQVVLPNKIRSLLYTSFARQKTPSFKS